MELETATSLQDAEATFLEWLKDVDEYGWKRVHLRDRGSWSVLVFQPTWVTCFEVSRGRLSWVPGPDE
jgi:hypothetical protein